MKWAITTMTSPFNSWWLYEMGKDAAKRPNREVSNGAFAVVVVCFVLSLILFGVFVAICVWYFTS